jgi:hypothetical protein
MDKKSLWSLFLFLFAAALACGRGEEEAPAAPVDNEWVLCITSFDVSTLPGARGLMGDTLTRELAAALERVNRRYRSGEETEYYRNYAWSKARAAKAKELANKRNERDGLLYQGNPGWKYRKDLKTREAEITRLEADFLKLESEIPAVTRDPVFKFTESNKNGTWPAPPVKGGEYRFCSAQKADAFLTGTVSEYHDRILVTLRMYTIYTRSYGWEDGIIFSSTDLNAAMDELSGRLAAAASGTLPAGIVVHSQPEDAMVLIDGAYAGRGEMPLREQAPGKAEVSIYADSYSSAVFPVELNSGEIAELYLNLAPLSLAAFEVDVPGNEGASVYLGSLFMGTTPLALELPRDNFTYIRVETPSGEIGSAVYRGGRVVRGSAEFVRAPSGDILSYETSVPVSPEEKRVNTSRRRFYGAYGRFWVALPVSLLAIGIAGNYVNAYIYQGVPEMYDPALKALNVQRGAYVVIGLAAADVAFRIFRYLYISRSDSVPITRFPKQEQQ